MKNVEGISGSNLLGLESSDGFGKQDYLKFISYARKPQAFKPGDEWHPFEASQVKPGEAEQFPA